MHDLFKSWKVHNIALTNNKKYLFSRWTIVNMWFMWAESIMINNLRLCVSCSSLRKRCFWLALPICAFASGQTRHMLLTSLCALYYWSQCWSLGSWPTCVILENSSNHTGFLFLNNFFSTADRVGCLTAVRMSAWAKLSRFGRRFLHVRQMDFESAASQMQHLLTQPRAVYRNFLYRKSELMIFLNFLCFRNKGPICPRRSRFSRPSITCTRFFISFLCCGPRSLNVGIY